MLKPVITVIDPVALPIQFAEEIIEVVDYVEFGINTVATYAETKTYFDEMLNDGNYLNDLQLYENRILEYYNTAYSLNETIVTDGILNNLSAKEMEVLTIPLTLAVVFPEHHAQVIIYYNSFRGDTTNAVVYNAIKAYLSPLQQGISRILAQAAVQVFTAGSAAYNDLIAWEAVYKDQLVAALISEIDVSTIVADANTVNDSLGTKITNATALSDSLTASISAGNTLASALGTASIAANNTKLLLTSANSTASTTLTSLNAAILAGDLVAMNEAIALNTAKVSNVTTDLSIGAVTATTVNVVSSDGEDATIPAATITTAGVMTAADKTKLGAVTGTNTGDQTTITGNAGSATKLATARNINSVAFDGTANITINAVDATARIASTEKGAINGVATLDASGTVPTSQLPSYVDDVLEFATLSVFPATGTAGKIYVDLATNKTYRWSGTVYIYITSGAVDSVAGKNGVVLLVKADVGLGNVDNTTDLNKPISNATQTALNFKAPLASPVFTGNVTGLGVATGTSFNAITGLAAVAPLADGTAAIGTSTLAARQDHVHPSSGMIPLTVSVTKTVGSGGDFATIKAALEWFLVNYYPSSEYPTAFATISLLTGFVMAEQIFLRGVNAGWINITSVDAEVTITRSALTASSGIQYPVFAGKAGAVLPKIQTLFNMDTSGTATGRNGIDLLEGSTAIVLSGKGVKNCGGTGVYSIGGSTLIANGAVFTGCSAQGILLTGSSIAEISNANLSGAGVANNIGLDVQGGCYAYAQSINCSGRTKGISVTKSATVEAVGSNVTSCTTNGVYVTTGGRLSCTDTMIGASNSTSDTVVATGGIIVKSGSVGGVSQAVNTLTSSGIIFN